MKKFYLNLLAVLAMVVTCVGFASCSSDDDDDKKDNIENITGNNDGSSNSNSLVGTWKRYFSDGSGFLIYVFNRDGSGYYQEYDEGHLWDKDPFDWTYNSSTKTIKMFYADEDGTYEERWIIKKFDGNSITIITEGDEETYFRQ